MEMSTSENETYLRKLALLVMEARMYSDYKTNEETKAYFDELIGTDGNSGKMADLINGLRTSSFGGENGTFTQQTLPM